MTFRTSNIYVENLAIGNTFLTILHGRVKKPYSNLYTNNQVHEKIDRNEKRYDSVTFAIEAESPLHRDNRDRQGRGTP